ncbi:MAG: DUF1572 domain-containing protein [Flavobacterium sp. BFFFF1]|uniref:DUF1572 domain-containing protein n=1 Tax=Flavobacterium sp. BFFFF1 TaxID=2015557 RepID=UPI000BD57AB4|nr:DUF1572 domain-containing protein [Flavobacterium sp. BFFFF1]OYU80571.1 MAG: DUF1572 domain-containing protein [Flavobacterium sp. BFFFF1]
MIQDTHQLAKRFREVILDGTWVANTNFKDQLYGMSLEMATAKVGNLNTIAVLAQHIHYYIAGLNTVFSHGTLGISDKYSFDFPPMESQQQWDNFLDRLWSDAEKFASAVEQMLPEKLSEPFVYEQYGSYLRNIDCMIEHSYYHLGQVVIIKKLLQKGI